VPEDLLAELELKLRAAVKEPGTIDQIGDLLFPGVSGHSNVKFGLLCMMANQWDLPNERERIHVLLHGKPGTGKTALMWPLELNWGAKYISMDPSAASLKADGRRKDRGSMIFNRSSGGIVCIDDFELMQNKNTLRDVMERGRYADDKGGADKEYDAYCRILAATNDLRKIPEPIVSRFDLVFRFTFPTIEQSMDIVRQMLNCGDESIDYLPILRHYIYLVQTHTPATTHKSLIEEEFEKYFDKYGMPTEEGSKGGKEGRWIYTISRLSKAIARTNLGNIGPAEVARALEIKHESDEIVKKAIV
jgi:DNA replicative helicase MCM subunit Mcm2 (Cdc46/Mcm family)